MSGQKSRDCMSTYTIDASQPQKGRVSLHLGIMTCFWCGLDLANTHHSKQQMAEHLRPISGVRQGLLPLVCKGLGVANIPATDIFQPIVLLYSVLRSNQLKALMIVSMVHRRSFETETVVPTVLMAIEWRETIRFPLLCRTINHTMQSPLAAFPNT